MMLDHLLRVLLLVFLLVPAAGLAVPDTFDEELAALKDHDRLLQQIGQDRFAMEIWKVTARHAGDARVPEVLLANSRFYDGFTCSPPGMRKDPVLAKMWALKAVETATTGTAKWAECMIRLADLSEGEGWGLLMKVEHEARSAACQNFVAHMYLNSGTCRPNIARAQYFAERAADQTTTGSQEWMQAQTMIVSATQNASWARLEKLEQAVQHTAYVPQVAAWKMEYHLNHKDLPRAMDEYRKLEAADRMLERSSILMEKYPYPEREDVLSVLRGASSSIVYGIQRLVPKEQQRAKFDELQRTSDNMPLNMWIISASGPQ